MIGSFFHSEACVSVAPEEGGFIKKSRWKWLTLRGLLSSAGALSPALRASQGSFRWPVFVATLTRLDWGWLLAAVGFALVTYYVRALRWAVLLKPVQPHPNMRRLISATVIGFTAITLLGRPGEFVRPYLIALQERVPFSSQISAWVLERIYDLLIALAIFGFALSHVRNLGDPGPALSAARNRRLAAGSWQLPPLLLILVRHYSDAMRRRLLEALSFLQHRLDRAGRFLEALFQGAESTRSAKSVFLLVAYTIMEWTLIVLCFFCIMQAYGTDIQLSVADVLIFMGFVSFGAIVQIPGIGGGVQVVAVVVLTKIVGFTVELATSVGRDALAGDLCCNCALRPSGGSACGPELAEAARPRTGGSSTMNCPFCGHLRQSGGFPGEQGG